MNNANQGNTIVIVLLIIAASCALLNIMSKNLHQIYNSANLLTDNLAVAHYSNLALAKAEQEIYQLECPNQNCRAGFAQAKLAQCQNYSSLAQRRACALNAMYGITTMAALCNRNSPWQGFCGYFQNYILLPQQNPSYRQTLPDLKPPCTFYSSDLTTSGHFIIPLIDDGNNHYTHSIETNNKLLCAQPKYLIEFLDLDYCDGDAYNNPKISHGNLYRITTRAFGINGNVQNTVQEELVVDTNEETAAGKAIIVRLSRHQPFNSV